MQLGRVGLWTFQLDLQPAPGGARDAAELEELGYPTLWVPEAVGRDPFVNSAHAARRDRAAGARHRHRQHLGPGRHGDAAGHLDAERGLPRPVPARHGREPPADGRLRPGPPLRQAAHEDGGVPRRDGRAPSTCRPGRRGAAAGAGRPRPEDARARRPRRPTAPTRTSCPSSTRRWPARPWARGRCSAPSRPSCSTPTPSRPGPPPASTWRPTSRSRTTRTTSAASAGATRTSAAAAATARRRHRGLGRRGRHRRPGAGPPRRRRRPRLRAGARRNAGRPPAARSGAPSAPALTSLVDTPRHQLGRGCPVPLGEAGGRHAEAAHRPHERRRGGALAMCASIASCDAHCSAT